MSEKQVLMRCKYKYDGFLWKVLALWGNEYVVWDYNHQSGGFAGGRYYTNLGDAIVCYIRTIIEKSLVLDIKHIQVRGDGGDDTWIFSSGHNHPYSNCGMVENPNMSAAMLSSVFGKPVEGDMHGDGKTSIEWSGVIDGYCFSIYDYKDHKPVDKKREWSIGGFDGEYVSFLVNEKIRATLIELETDLNKTGAH